MRLIKAWTVLGKSYYCFAPASFNAPASLEIQSSKLQSGRKFVGIRKWICSSRMLQMSEETLLWLLLRCWYCLCRCVVYRCCLWCCYCHCYQKHCCCSYILTIIMNLFTVMAMIFIFIIVIIPPLQLFPTSFLLLWFFPGISLLVATVTVLLHILLMLLSLHSIYSAYVAGIALPVVLWVISVIQHTMYVFSLCRKLLLLCCDIFRPKRNVTYTEDGIIACELWLKIALTAIMIELRTKMWSQSYDDNSCSEKHSKDKMVALVTIA